MPSRSVSTGVLPLAPFSIASEIPSPSLSVSYGSVKVVPSVFGGVTPPFELVGIPFVSTVPSTFPSPSVSVPLDSITSGMPSLSLSESILFGMPSPSVSQSGADGVHAAASTVSKIPSLSSSASLISYTPSPSVSTGQPFKFARPASNGH